MPIFNINEKQFLFIHIPRTGGTCIEKWLSKEGAISFFSSNKSCAFSVSPQHFVMRDLHLILGESTWSYAFSIIRNPYRRIESEYLYRTKWEYQKIQKRPQFSTWLINQLNLASEHRCHLDNHLRPQTDFIDEGVELFYFEDGLDRIAQEVSRKIGVKAPGELSVVNESHPSEVTWTLEAYNEFHRFYANDFDQLDFPRVKPSLNIRRKSDAHEKGRFRLRYPMSRV